MLYFSYSLKGVWKWSIGLKQVNLFVHDSHKTFLLEKAEFNPFMHNVVKWPNILLKSCGVHNARF